MLSLKGFFGVVALAVLSQPAWALNDDASGSLANGTTQANPPIEAAPAPAPVARACPVCLKRPALSDAERARRKAIRAERAALGIQPPQRTAAQIAAHRARTICPSPAQ